MIKTEFGIIDDFNEKNDYTGYYPDKYNCVAIDDDRYINAWWKELSKINTLNVYKKGVCNHKKHYLAGESPLFRRLLCPHY